jgi:hypothetical protein
MTNKSKLVSGFIIGTFVLLYVITSLISTIHVIDFFRLSNPEWLAISLALAFEVGAAASLASLVVLDKMNKFVVWSLFIILTLVQAMGNTYYAYSHLNDFDGWIELFGLVEEDPIYQKRILSIISGAILPIVSLGFIKSLVDYIRPEVDETYKNHGDDNFENLDAPVSNEDLVNIDITNEIQPVEEHQQVSLRDLVYRETPHQDPTRIK